MTLSAPAAPSPRSAATMIRRRARAHSRLVRVLRWLMPTLILALFGLLGAFVVAQARRAAAERPKDMPTEIRMISPHFVGRDDQGRSFSIAAREAVRDDADMQRVLLTAPSLALDVDSDHPKTLTADRGVYDENTRILRLNGHVRVDDSTASTVGAEQAIVDTRAGTVSGDSPIAGSGPMGAIRAGSYTVSEKGQTVVMHGGVHAVLNGR